jgi:hypothetical protein
MNNDGAGILEKAAQVKSFLPQEVICMQSFPAEPIIAAKLSHSRARLHPDALRTLEPLRNSVCMLLHASKFEALPSGGGRTNTDPYISNSL